MTPSRLLFSICWLLTLAGLAGATQTAFWRPYTTDQNTYGLFHFDQDALTAAEGVKYAAEVSGDARFEPQGKIGGALHVGGKGAVKFIPAAVFPGGRVSIEAWVKLEKYPEREGYIVYRQVVTGKTKGFALLVNAKGAPMYQVVNSLNAQLTRFAGPEGAVPLNAWVHVAAVDGMIYVNGKALATGRVSGWSGLVAGNEVEQEPGPIFIGNTDKGDAGISGLIDEVRIHRTVCKFWPQPDASWTEANTERKIPAAPPYLLDGHQPAFYLPLDGNLQPAFNQLGNVQVTGKDDAFPAGVKGSGYLGSALTLSGKDLMKKEEGSLEFWFSPRGVNNYSDFGWGFLECPAFTFYIIFTGVVTGGPIPLSAYFYKDNGQPHFIGDGAGREVYEGNWYHFVMTWHGKEITLYLNGREAGKTGSEAFRANSDRLNFHSATFDELYIYQKALTRDEVANCYARYRDPAALKEVSLSPVEVKAAYYPSTNTLYYTLTPNIEKEKLGPVTLLLRDSNKKEVARRQVGFSEAEGAFPIPDLPDGAYTVTASVADENGVQKESPPITFERVHFPWEGNILGFSNTIYPPYEPIKVQGNTINTVLRQHVMNGFGLWDSVTSRGKPLLAAPMTIEYETAAGAGKWQTARGAFTRVQPDAAVYQAEAAAGPVALKTTSTMEYDGCMKVEMTLQPGAAPEQINRLWIAIPVKEEMAPLFHAMENGTIRGNPSGAVPAGQGVVWDSSKAHSPNMWGTFLPYLWVGAQERGIAWFANNDKGWVTDDTKPEVTLSRENGQLVIRVYLINRPVTLDGSRLIVFGLQASPTKPMPADWRSKEAKDVPMHGGSNGYWGILPAYCGKYPAQHDYRFADEQLIARRTGVINQQFLSTWITEKIKAVSSDLAWINDRVAHVGAGMNMARGAGNNPLMLYFEEHGQDANSPEWIVFQDEWRPGNYGSFDRGKVVNAPQAGGGTGVTFTRTYQDFALWYAREWMIRGIGIYCDNTYPRDSFNTRSTDAYLREDGHIQSSALIWELREYHKRMWVLEQQCKPISPYPLQISLHMTNGMILPILTWADINLDNEWAWSDGSGPFPPELLQAEMLGLQVGNFPHALYPIIGNKNIVMNSPAPVPDRLRRAEWGMRFTHEIIRAFSDPKLEKLVRDFGYGTDACQVINYWNTDRLPELPTVAVANPKIKWIALWKPKEQRLMLAMVNWENTPQKTLFMAAGPKGAALSACANAETGVQVTDMELSFEGWEVKVLTLGVK